MKVEEFKGKIMDVVSGIGSGSDDEAVLDRVCRIVAEYTVDLEEKILDYFEREKKEHVPTGVKEFDDVMEIVRIDDMPNDEFFGKLKAIVDGWQ